MLKVFLGALGLIAIAGVMALGFAGVRGEKMTHTPVEWFNDMAHQPRQDPQHHNEFFADGRGARQPIPGTIPLGYLSPKGLDSMAGYDQVGATNEGTGAGFTDQPDYLNTGHMGEFFGDGIPEELAARADFLKRGQQRFDINCAICHGKTGAGDGVVKNFGMMTIRSIVDDQIKAQPDGQIFSTITHGKSTMGAYGPNIAVEDRWAIIAYIRALQRAQTDSKTQPTP